MSRAIGGLDGVACCGGARRGSPKGLGPSVLVKRCFLGNRLGPRERGLGERTVDRAFRRERAMDEADLSDIKDGL